jgi:hypothetical protein
MKFLVLLLSIFLTQAGAFAQELPKMKVQSLKISEFSGSSFLGHLQSGLSDIETNVEILCWSAGFLTPEVREVVISEKGNSPNIIGTFETQTLSKCYQLRNTVRSIVRNGHQALLNLDPVKGTVISVSESDGDDWNGPLPECVDCRG